MTENNYTVPRRAVWFVLRTVLIIIVVVTMTFFAFLTAMYASNIYIIVTEGMTIRAKCILGQGEKTEMEQYFSVNCMNNDEMLKDNVYEHYKIANYDYRLTVNKLNVLPWNKTASMIVTERIPTISGTPYEDAPTASVPEWTSLRYRVICMRENNRWYITKVEIEEKVSDNVARPTPNMSLTPIIPSTPTPEPTATAAVLPVSSEVTETKKP